MEKVVSFKLLKKKKILILGNTGFIGSWLSIVLKYFGANILGYSLKKHNKYYISNCNKYKKTFKTINRDIINFSKNLKNIIKFKPEIIIHLAAQSTVINSYSNTKKNYETNVMGTVEVFESLKKIKSVKKVILFTSDKVYKNLDSKIRNETSNLGGIDPYSASKTSQDIVGSSYYTSIFKKKIDIIILRAGNVIGGGDWGEFRLVPDIYRALEKGKTLVVRNYRSIRPWQHVLDITKAILLVILKSRNSTTVAKVYNIGPNINAQISVLDFLKKLSKFSKIRYKIGQNNFYESKILRLSNNLIKKELKWSPNLNIEQSIKYTSEWYDNFFKNKKKIYEITLNQIKGFYS